MEARPPSRYRVIERDRRLVVIDDWAEGGADKRLSAPSAMDAASRPVGKAKRIAFDGRSRFTTHRLFDAKAPRTIVLDPGSAATIERLKLVAGVVVAILVFLAVTAPYLLLPLVLLLQRRPRARIRSAITGWLDRAGGDVL
ncbi:MAG: hypothetical protein B7Y45_07110 [Sphingomonas sp. 28-66-16]|nr:MAG: hypothetical protein B7Y45_07110 [Sphingomonas sp. 28-66-16]